MVGMMSEKCEKCGGTLPAPVYNWTPLNQLQFPVIPTPMLDHLREEERKARCTCPMENLTDSQMIRKILSEHVEISGELQLTEHGKQVFEQQQDAALAELTTTESIILKELVNDQTGEWTEGYLKETVRSSAIDGLFHARRDAKLTQEQVAERTGKKQSAIARWESDTSCGMSLNQYIDLAFACGMVPVIELTPIAEVKQNIIQRLKKDKPTSDRLEAMKTALEQHQTVRAISNVVELKPGYKYLLVLKDDIEPAMRDYFHELLHTMGISNIVTSCPMDVIEIPDEPEKDKEAIQVREDIHACVVFINGTWATIECQKGRASYEEIVRWTRKPGLHTVVYRGGVALSQEGSLLPGETVPVQAGMEFTAYPTGNA